MKIEVRWAIDGMLALMHSNHEICTVKNSGHVAQWQSHDAYIKISETKLSILRANNVWCSACPMISFQINVYTIGAILYIDSDWKSTLFDILTTLHNVDI